jgi:hypothetical protein
MTISPKNEKKSYITPNIKTRAKMKRKRKRKALRKKN